MRQRHRIMRISAISATCLCLLAGCLETRKSLHYVGDAELDYYKSAATQIDYTEVCDPAADEALNSNQPHTLADRHRDQIWDLTLVEALHMAMSNNRIIRTDRQFSQAGSSLVSNPNFTSSVYDPAIQESGVLFGGRGVEAALSDFDANFSTTMLWGRNETVQNNAFFSGGLPAGSTLTQETGQFTSQLSKQFGYGGSFALSHNWNYLGTNSPGTLFPSSYAGNVAAQYRQPLWAGAGTEYTRIAGPSIPGFRGITGVSQGVVIARINNDITIADFEASVRDMLLDVESLYWDLYLQYRLYHTVVVAHNSALRTWREAKAKLDIGGARNFKPADEAQARDQLFATRAGVEAVLSNLYTAETSLRRLLGLPVNDGRVIRPADQPSIAQFVPDWHISLAEGLTERVEIRKQKWNIKSLELQLRAARSLTHPRLDFVSGYQVNGFGDKLWSPGDDDDVTAQGLNSAYETLTQGDQTGWNLGLEFSMPLGFRSAHAQVRNYELRLAKARETLAAQELDIAHELAVAFQNLAKQYQTAQSNLNRLNAAQSRVDLFEAELEAGTATLDLVLRAQTSLADAERDYYTSLTDYNKAIAQLHYRKGTLLDYDNVYLAEGEWTPEAYEESLRRAWARSHAFDANRLRTEPEEFVLPEGANLAPEYGRAHIEGEGDAYVPAAPAEDPLMREIPDRFGVPPEPTSKPGSATVPMPELDRPPGEH